jgi:hypothetical protein
MFGLSSAHPPTRLDELQHALRTLETFVSRLKSAPAAKARPDVVASTIVERLADIAEQFRDGAMRAGSDASRLGRGLSESGRDSLSLVSREVSANPMVAVGAAVGIGVLIGMALLQSLPTRSGPRVRKVRKVRE